ncbi:MAG: efflux RND transporter periplasmic adaptor subunit [Deltaproteobacteria bacterium]
MRRSLTYILLIAAGVMLGGAGAWFYASKKQPEPQARQARKILFYRNPMNPEVTSPVPLKDDMGMDYAPVYEDEAAETDKEGVVRISPERIQRIGVQSEEVGRQDLKRVIRTVGRVAPVEDKIYVINAKIAGWVEKLYLNRTDQMVKKGEPLLELFSPDLTSAQEEYLLALKSLDAVRESPYPEVKKGAESLVEAARKRLKYWDISDDQIARLGETGKIKRTMTIMAPAEGSVTEKMVSEGQMIEPGEPLFKIIDHSSVWVYGEVYEYEMPYIAIGQGAALTPSYSPADVYSGRIEHIYSHLGSTSYSPDEGTEVRTAKVRFELQNANHRLKLGMYLNVEISVVVATNAVAVPDSSVIDTGTRQIVIVDRRDGTFEPREITPGAKADNFHEIKEGIEPGEWVVSTANFLLDSESNLKAAIKGMGAQKERPAEAPETKAPAGHSH